MTRIRDLSRKSSMNNNDIFPVWDGSQAATRSASFQIIRDAIPYIVSVVFVDPNLTITYSDDSTTVTPIIISSVPQNIIQVTGNYNQLATDDVIVITGPATLNLIQASTALKSISIKSKLGGGDVTITPFAGDTVADVSSVILSSGTGNTFAPITLDWEILA